MTHSRTHRRFVLALVVLLVALLTSGSVLDAARKKKSESEESDRPEPSVVQSLIMGFADSYTNSLDGATLDLRTQGLEGQMEPEDRLALRSSMTFSMVAAIDIAAGPNPAVAVLDMVVLTSLNRLYLEGYWRPRIGEAADPFLRNHVRLEKEIWEIAGRLLSPEEQRELRSMIGDWYDEHPDLFLVNYIRFSDFAEERQKSTLVEAVKKGGLLKPLKETEQELEQTRLLGERALYVATRMPTMTGSMIDIWLTAWAQNPEMAQVVSILQEYADSAESWTRCLSRRNSRGYTPRRSWSTASRCTSVR